MESKVKSMGHPIHPMLVNFPLGLLVTSAVFDLIHLITGNDFPVRLYRLGKPVLRKGARIEQQSPE